MKHFLYLSVILLGCIFFASCEGNTTREWKIKNNSSSVIYADLDVIQSPVVIDTIEAGETGIFAISDAPGGDSEPGSPLDGINNMLIYNSTDTVSKSFMKESNWITNSEERKKRPSDYYHEFIFEVGDGDF